MAGILWPVPDKYPISQGFGRPAHWAEPTMWLLTDPDGKERKCRPAQFAGAVQYKDVHPGVDIKLPIGTPVRAPANGKVILTQTYRVWCPPGIRADLPKGGYTIVNDIYFKFGHAVFYATHLDRFVVKAGTQATRGTIIARTGDTGISTGPHIHLETRQVPDGADPLSWSLFRWNPRRLREGGDLAGVAWIKPTL